MSTMTLNSAANQFLPLDPTSSDWKDVTPVYQQDSNSALCPILYDIKYSSAMDLLRSILASPSPERSARTLALTEHLIRLNPSNYSIWNYRAYILLGPSPLESNLALDRLSRQILSGEKEELKKSLQEELDFIEVLASENMKSYQVWQHRRLILTALSDPERELDFVKRGLEKDSKNYHTWVYRQWVLSHFAGLKHDDDDDDKETEKVKENENGNRDLNQCSKLFPHLWNGELDYVEELLTQDIRNNSAWNHRYFVLFSSGRFRSGKQIGCQGGEEGTILREIEYTKSKIQKVPNNASPWNYLRGLLSLINPNPNANAGLNPKLLNDPKEIYSDLSSFSESLLPTREQVSKDPNVDSNGNSPIGALEFCLDALENRIRTQSSEEREKLREEISFWVERLFKADPIRKRYWNHRRREMEKLL